MALIAAGLAMIAAIHLTPLGNSLGLDHVPVLRHHLELAGPWAPALFITLGAGSLMVGLPRAAYCLLGGALFDFWHGLAWCIAGSLAGSLAAFAIARTLGRDWFYQRWGQRYARIEDRMRSDGFVVVLLARLCPATNNLLINGLAGISAVRAGSFFRASLAGFAPSTAILVLMGSGVAVADFTRTLISLGLFALATLVTITYYHRTGIAGEVWHDLTSRE